MQITHDGKATLIQMLNENTKEGSTNIFLNFILKNCKRVKNDDKRDLP